MEYVTFARHVGKTKARKATTEDYDIVSELAALPAPLAPIEVDFDSWDIECIFCQVRSDKFVGAEEELQDPALHEPLCLWRRAKEERS